MFGGIPSAPGKPPNRLSKLWFSIMISITCLIGGPGMLSGPGGRVAPALAGVSSPATTAAVASGSAAAPGSMRFPGTVRDVSRRIGGPGSRGTSSSLSATADE